MCASVTGRCSNIFFLETCAFVLCVWFAFLLPRCIHTRWHCRATTFGLLGGRPVYVGILFWFIGVAGWDRWRVCSFFVLFCRHNLNHLRFRTTAFPATGKSHPSLVSRRLCMRTLQRPSSFPVLPNMVDIFPAVLLLLLPGPSFTLCRRGRSNFGRGWLI